MSRGFAPRSLLDLSQVTEAFAPRVSLSQFRSNVLSSVRPPLRYYADVRLLGSVRVRIAATGFPLSSHPVIWREPLSSPGSRT